MWQTAVGSLIRRVYVVMLLVVGTAQADTELLSKPLKMGALLCLTGPCAEWGQNSLKGVQLAVEEINSNGGLEGRRIELVVQDTKEGNGGAHSVSAFKSLLLDSDIHYIIGPSWSVGGLPVAPLVSHRPDILVTSPSVGVAQFNETAPNIFNTWPHDSYATEGLAELMFARGFRRVAIYSANEPWVSTQGNTFERRFKELGGTITVKIEINPDATELSAEALQIKTSNSDAVFYSNTYTLAQMARKLRDLKFSGAQFAIQMDLTRARAAQGALNGAIFALFPEANDDFKKKYLAKFGDKPGITADTAYDTVYAYAHAIRVSKSFEAGTVAAALLKSDFLGASGRVVFDDKGGVVREPAFFIVKGETFEAIGKP